VKCEFGSEKERRKNSSKFSIPNSEFNFLGATELARLIRAREASPADRGMIPEDGRTRLDLPRRVL
jgi:hypothetical protein